MNKITDRVKVKSFILHDTLNIAGKNFKSGSANAPTVVTPDMDVTYDEERKRLFICYKGHLRIVDTVNIWEPLDYAAYGYSEAPTKAPIGLSQSTVPQSPIKAQVEVPHEKVQNPPTRRSVK